MKKKRKKKQTLYIFDRQKLKLAIKQKNREQTEYKREIKKGKLLTLYSLFENYQNLLNEKTTEYRYEYPNVRNDISKVDIGSDTMPMLFIHARKIAWETGHDIKTIKNHIRQLRHKSNELITIVDVHSGSSFGVKIPYHYFIKVLKFKSNGSFQRNYQ
ncbi:hypothetical protein [uncultured Dokdonia sp.]|uniref:hypothetical protein n=1 Tax=uncultured Dokdonia sp. TaxID=575653 RepID=UPI0026102C24|nr:hypothetical protein [uncultured Dokdonia sp.]